MGSEMCIRDCGCAAAAEALRAAGASVSIARPDGTAPLLSNHHREVFSRYEREAEAVGGPLQRLRLLRQQLEDILERAIYCLRKLEDAAVAIVRVDRIDEC